MPRHGHLTPADAAWAGARDRLGGGDQPSEPEVCDRLRDLAAGRHLALDKSSRTALFRAYRMGFAGGS